ALRRRSAGGDRRRYAGGRAGAVATRAAVRGSGREQPPRGGRSVRRGRPPRSRRPPRAGAPAAPRGGLPAASWWCAARGGLVELKTNAKTALIVRRERDGIRRYVHIGTGNYNAATAAVYTDVGLLSADPELGADLNDLFNELSGSSRPPQTAFRRILVSPTY